MVHAAYPHTVKVCGFAAKVFYKKTCKTVSWVCKNYTSSAVKMHDEPQVTKKNNRHLGKENG